jgi:hypothetical protein
VTRDDVPERFRRLYDLAMTGKSRKAGVKAFCLMCVAWKRAEVFRCTSSSCPLFPYRPKLSKSAANGAKRKRRVPGVPPKPIASNRERER